MAKPRINHETHLAEVLERRQKKFADAVVVAKAEAELEAAKREALKPAPPQDHVPPKIGAKEILATHKALMEITSARRLQALARKHPEVAKLLEAAKPADIPLKAAPIPPLENPDELHPV